MAGKMNGRMPASFQKSTAARTIVAMFAMPRLPAPTATRAPGFSLCAKPASCSSRRTVPAMSATRRSGKCWRTSSVLENGIPRF
jgi:hypothetical protein